MKFYAVANKEIQDCYYDFECDTWGDGLCSNNYISSERLIEELFFEYELDEEGVIIEVYISDITRQDKDAPLSDESDEIISVISQYIWDDTKHNVN